jgi:hypothetical protein
MEGTPWCPLYKGYKKDIFERVLTGFELSAFMPTLIVQ